MNIENTEKIIANFLDGRDAKGQALIKEAVSLAKFAGGEYITPYKETCFSQGLAMGEILNKLKVDSTTLAATVVYSTVKYTDLDSSDVIDHLGEKVAKLTSGTMQMDKIGDFYRVIMGRSQNTQNIDNMRKMFIAMVDDIRVVLIKLAEELYISRAAVNLPEEKRREIANEIKAIYAPLANRLGMVFIKRELEDLSFQYLEPEKYQEIYNDLSQTKDSREEYINSFIENIKNILAKNRIKNFKISGRPKHLYSIYLKMQRKKTDFAEIYDTNAVRILVPTIEDCYKVLSCIHSIFSHIPKEFDDYIIHPKLNGYRSIHTAVIGPNNTNVEIQIRTFQMHTESELGFAAHWVYKEGDASHKTNYEEKIAWLRQVMDWQQEITSDEKIISDIRRIFSDHVYIFTPAGDILELPQGATPLDFAYMIHSDIGHRCVGAKVNGSIVPLTYNLKTADRIEILNAKNPRPSRDWLNPSLGFLKTSRAKSKVLQWFKKENFAQNVVLGQGILEKELYRQGGALQVNFEEIVKKLNYKTKDELLADLGNGALKVASIMNLVQKKAPMPAEEIAQTLVAIKLPKKESLSRDFCVEGIDNLLTRIANCCKPIPGDEILGYVTQSSGVTIHRADCQNALYALKARPERILMVSWGAEVERKYNVDIAVNAFDRRGLVRDITSVLADEGLMITGLHLSIDKKANIVTADFTITISNMMILAKILAKIRQLDDVLEAKRKI